MAAPVEPRFARARRLWPRAITGTRRWPTIDYVNELVDVGVDFTRQLSLRGARRSAFSTQTSVRQTATTGGSYRLNGSVELRRRISAHLAASAGVGRATGIPARLRRAAVHRRGDGASLGGMLSKRAEWSTTISRRPAAGSASMTHGQLSRPGTPVAVERRRITRALRRLRPVRVFITTSAAEPRSRSSCRAMSRQVFAVGVKTWISIYQQGEGAS